MENQKAWDSVRLYKTLQEKLTPLTVGLPTSAQRDNHECDSFHVHVALTNVVHVHVYAHDKETNMKMVVYTQMPTLSATQSNWYNQQHKQSKQQLHVASYSTTCSIQSAFILDA